MSAHFNNDTSHDEDEFDVNTTLFTLASTTLPASKKCVLEEKKRHIADFFKRDTVNVVNIHVLFVNGSHKQMLSNFRVTLLNPIGREILCALENTDSANIFTWTLKAGIRNFTLNVDGSQNDCIKTRKNVSDFVREITQQIVDSVKLETNDEVWSSFKDTSTNETSCLITKPNLGSELSRRCLNGESYIFGNPTICHVLHGIVCVVVLLHLKALLLAFLSRSEFELNNPKYYKLEESTMSPSSILFKLFWKEYNWVSLLRCLAVAGSFGVTFWIFVMSMEKNKVLFSISASCVWVFSFLLFYALIFENDPSHSLEKMKVEWNLIVGCLEFIDLPKHENLNIAEYVTSRQFSVILEMYIVPLTIKKFIKYFDSLSTQNKRIPDRLRHGSALVRYFSFCLLLCMVLAALAILLSLLRIVILVILIYVMKHSIIYPPNILRKILFIFFSFLNVVGLLVFLSIFIITITKVFAIQSFLLGLFLNLIYFMPYFAFISVLTFYCYTYWKSMEEKYFVLKRLIYEACRETENINNGCIPNRHPKPKEKVIPVVSKELYDKIREGLLPYDTNLFYFGLKMFWSIAFSLGIFALINMLNESNVTGLVQVVTTASLGVVPHIFNMVALKTSEARTKAKNENLKLNIKNMVKELIGKDQKLARTVLIIEQDDYTRPVNPSFFRRLKWLFCCCRENFDGQNYELVPTVSRGNDTTTDDERTEVSEHFETTFGTSSDNDDVENFEPAQTVRRNDETATDVNVQNSEYSNTMTDLNSHYDEVEDVGPAQWLFCCCRENFDGQNYELVPTVSRGNDTTTDDENTEVSEHFETTFGTSSDNDDVENFEPAQTVTGRRDDETATDVNVELSEYSNTMTDLNSHCDEVEDDRLSPTVTAQRNHETATHNDNDNTKDVGPAQTLVIQENNDTQSEESIQDFERADATFGSNVPDNVGTDNVGTDDVEPAQENNGTTSEKSIQESDYIATRSGSKVSRNDNVEQVQGLPAAENNETTFDENIHNSGDTPARSDLNSTFLPLLSTFVFVPKQIKLHKNALKIS